ncbi:MAG: tyrosine-protein phosphatase [Bacilli bacterium]|nr:tyrosine-protein phosphatase [Bacilli bacterium]
MKKTKILCVMSALFLMTACGGTKFKTEWSSDANNHWHAAESGDEKDSLGKHVFGDPTVDGAKIVAICKTCGYKADYNADGIGGFNNVTKFADPIEIHTAAQKEYLSYTGEYKTIPTNNYPDGSKKNSNPVQVANKDVEATKTTLSWDYENHSANVKYSVSLSTKMDFSDGFEIKGTNEQSLDLYNLFLGTNFYRINAYEGDDVTTSGVYSLNVDTTYPRNLYIGNNMTNCRDMGGRVLPSGGTIRQGLIYRTCGNGYQSGGTHIPIDDEGKDIMINQLKVKTEIVLHNDNGYNFNLDGTTVYNTYMDYKGQTKSKHHLSRNTENVVNVFRILADENNYPTYYHCRIGTDRTGLVAILLNGVLGVPLNEIYQDYLFSNFGEIGEKRYIGSQAGQDDISVYISEIEAMPGKDFQEKTYNALISIGVSKENIAKVMSILVEGAAPTNDNGQVVVSPKDMTAEGTTVEHEDKVSLTARNKPEYSAVMSAGAKVTAKVNVTKAGEKALYAYLGNSEQTTSKKIGSSISATVDGNAVTIPDITFEAAGFGTCGSGRVNYYFVKLGDLGELSVGEHTVEITGVANNLILGNLAVVC